MGTKFFCDRCKVEYGTNGVLNLIKIYSELDEDVDYQYELCNSCKGQLEYFLKNKDTKVIK